MSFDYGNPQRHGNPEHHRGSLIGWVYLALLSAAFCKPLYALAIHALDDGLYSYILLVPFVSLYLLGLRRERLPRVFVPALGWVVASMAMGLLALAAGLGWVSLWRLGPDEALCCLIFAYLCLLCAGGFWFLGLAWMSAAAFPAAFLLFMIPLPERTVVWLEGASQAASADAASQFFDFSGTPYLRQDYIFRLPNIVIEVARECSGIRSSLILFITSILAADLLLRTAWRRALLVAFVIPLGVLRNGFRIWTIAQLCVYVGPHMIDSPIHRRGGPLFFALSLVPLLLLIWWLRRGEALRKPKWHSLALPAS